MKLHDELVDALLLIGISVLLAYALAKALPYMLAVRV